MPLPQAAGKPRSGSALCKTTYIDPTYDCTLDSRYEKGDPLKYKKQAYTVKNVGYQTSRES